MRSATKAAVVLVVTLFLAAGVSQAAAESWGRKDAQKDVYHYDVSENTSKAPKNKSADIVKAKFLHTKKALKGRFALRQVVDKGYYGVRAHVRTSDGGEYDLYMSWKAGKKANGALQSPTEDEYNVACAKKRVTYSTKRDTIAFRLPTSCLGRPDWVRAGFEVTQTSQHEFLVGHVDDALHKGEKKKNPFVLAVSPKLSRG